MLISKLGHCVNVENASVHLLFYDLQPNAGRRGLGAVPGLKLMLFGLQMRHNPTNSRRPAPGGRQEGLPPCHLRQDLEVARPAQERVEAGSRPLKKLRPGVNFMR